MRRLRREARRLARSVLLFAHLAVGALACHAVFPLVELTRVDRSGRWRETVIRFWMRVLLRILRVKLRVKGSIRGGAVLYCANHVSWLDIPCLRAVVDAAFIAKAEVRRWPLLGGMAARAGTMFLARGDGTATHLVAERMTWLLAAHKPVIVFPEGTSTDGTTVLRFHARLYQAATRINGHAQAVAIRYPRGPGTNPVIPFVGDDDLARHLWRLLTEESIEAELRFCEPLAAHGRERRALAEAARGQILAALARDSAPAAVPQITASTAASSATRRRTASVAGEGAIERISARVERQRR